MAKAFFKRRPLVNIAKPVAVTISGSGNSSYCYATINGTKYPGAASGITVMTGDLITFGVYGLSSTYYGAVTIDGTMMVKATQKNTTTFNWVVPYGVKTITIALSYTSTISRRNGRITVTTS